MASGVSLGGLSLCGRGLLDSSSDGYAKGTGRSMDRLRLSQGYGQRDDHSASDEGVPAPLPHDARQVGARGDRRSTPQDLPVRRPQRPVRTPRDESPQASCTKGLQTVPRSRQRLTGTAVLWRRLVKLRDVEPLRRQAQRNLFGVRRPSQPTSRGQIQGQPTSPCTRRHGGPCGAQS